MFKFNSWAIAFVSLFSIITLSASSVRADHDPSLRKGYIRVRPLVDDATPKTKNTQFIDRLTTLPTKSDVKNALAMQSPIKDQGDRGICSIFSAAGAIEWLYKKEMKAALDVSENFLAYTIFTKVNHSAQEGSDTPDDIEAASLDGLIEENVWPYDSTDWSSTEGQETYKSEIAKECGELTGKNHDNCLIIHHNPLVNDFTAQATAFDSKYSNSKLKVTSMTSMTDVKSALIAGTPVVLGINFYFASWNHGGMVKVGLGQPNRDLYRKGIVTAPTANDIKLSAKDPEGHSIVIIGYDDEQKVYFFKNSWGTDTWGSENALEKGYGTIAYDYANKHGSFYKVSLAR